MDDSPSDAYAVFGVSIEGPPPVGRIDLALEPGVIALYGRNGAGKTTALRAIRSAFKGIALAECRAFLHLRFFRPDWLHCAAEDEDAFGFAVLDAIGTAHVEREEAELLEFLPETDLESDEDRAALDNAIRAVLDPEPPSLKWAVSSALWHLSYSTKADAGSKALAEAAARSGCISLITDGSDGPTWQVWAAIGRPEETIDRHLDWLSTSPTTRVLGAVWAMGMRSIDAPAGTMAFIDRVAETERVSREEAEARLDAAANLPDPPRLLGALMRERVFAPCFDWVPLELIQISDLTSSGRVPDLVEEGVFDPLEATWRYVRDKLGTEPLLVTRDDGVVTLNQEALLALQEVSSQASRLLTTLLLEAPALRCEVHDPNDWPERGAILWKARDPLSGQWVSLNQLSKAQLRWAEVAIQSTLAGDQVSCVLIDEPEAALHARAERHLFQGLKQLAQRLSASVVVANSLI